jgi:hypothetical protein
MVKSEKLPVPKFITQGFGCDCGRVVNFEIPLSSASYANVICPYCEKVHPVLLQGSKEYQVRKETAIIHKAILLIFDEQGPRLTVRQIYYALTVLGVIPKTEAGYRQTCYHLKSMRQKGILPYGWIADNTRWHIKPTTYTGMDAALERMQEAYRRDLWADQRDYIEIWVEKDALAGVISPITREYDVPLYVARGYGSITFIFEAAEGIRRIGKPTYIYYFSDFDPSGVDAAFKIRDGLREHGALINFERVAVTEEHIIRLNLPTRPTKKSDPRSKKWGDKPSVELDALPAPELRDLVSGCIEQHIDADLLERTKRIEELERETLANVRKNVVQVQNSS